MKFTSSFKCFLLSRSSKISNQLAISYSFTVFFDVKWKKKFEKDKMKRFHNWMAPMKRAIVTACILLIAANFADAQTSTVSSETSTNPSEISSISTQELGVFKSSTESSAPGCSHCNLVEEVSLRVNQQFSREK